MTGCGGAIDFLASPDKQDNQPERTAYVVTLLPAPGTDAIRNLRHAVKRLKRSYALTCTGMTRTAGILKFPPRAIILSEAPEGGWLVLTPRGHGWLHGSRRDAFADARWFGRNHGLDVLESTTTSS